jgi:hypothetical protein
MAKSLTTQVVISNASDDNRIQAYFRERKGNSLFRTSSSPFRY